MRRLQTHAPLTRLARTPFNTADAMLFYGNNLHAIIIWVRHTHGHWSLHCYHHLVLSTDTVTHLHAIIILWVRVGRLLFDRYIYVLSSCEFDRHIVMLSSSCESLKLLPRLTLLQWHIVMLSSSCALDRHIVMLSSSCGFDRQIGNDSAFYHHPVSSTFMSTSTRGRFIIE